MATSASEREPLLAATAQYQRVRQTPLPKLKLAIVFAVKLLIPVASSQASPYINRLIEQIVGSSEKVGYYTGLSVRISKITQRKYLGNVLTNCSRDSQSSSFSLAQTLAMYPWARLSDRIGRRPVVLIGSVGIAVSTALFGFVDSLWEIVVFRFLCKHCIMSSFTVLITRSAGGLFCGTTGAVHAIVGELTDETNQSTAFPLYDIVAAVGLMVGYVSLDLTIE